MCSARDAHIVRSLKDHSIRFTGSGHLTGTERTIEIDLGKFRKTRLVIGVLHAEIGECEEVMLDGFFVGRKIHCAAERVNRTGTDQVGITQHERVGSPRVIGLTYRNPVLTIVVARGIQAGKLVTAKHRVFVVDLIVHLPDVNVLVRIVPPPKTDLAARIGRRGQPLCYESNGGRRKQCGIDSIIGEWGSQRDLPALIAKRRGYRCPITSEHLGSRHVCNNGSRLRADDRRLQSGEEKELVLLDGSADRPAELVALQTISFGRECIACVKYFVPDKLE